MIIYIIKIFQFAFSKILMMVFFLFLTSCVYFNTYYNAKHSFEDARCIIDEQALLSDSFDQNQLSPVAKKKITRINQ